MLAAFTISARAASPQAMAALSKDPGLGYAPDSVLVRFKGSASPADKRQARSLVNGARIRGYGVVKGLEHMQVGKGQGVERAVERLQQLPFVDYVEPDYVRRADTSDTYYGYQWGLNNTGQDIGGVTGTAGADIDAEGAWTLSTGDPDLVVAVIDSGVEYTHEDLWNNAWINHGEIAGDNVDNDGNGYVDDVYGWDFFASDADPYDENGHGTHVAGTICAEGNNGRGVSGVAWGCKVMALRFLGPDGGYTSDAISALEYAVAKGVRLSNNSWGGGGYSQALYDAIDSAAASGHLFVAAAGNGGTDKIGDDNDVSAHYPSSYDLANVIAVAATDNRDRLADFSNFGAQGVDLGAPGVDIASTMRSGYYLSSGTSMATPHVTGVAALILGRHPDWSYVDVRDRLLNTVRAVDSLTGKTVTGGVVDAYEALLEPAVAPTAPEALTANTVSDTEIALEWSDTSDNEDGFRIERSLDQSSWFEAGSVARDSFSYTDGSLDADTTYYYRVKAYNSAGDSPYSNLASDTTDPAAAYQEVVSHGESFGTGTVQGSHENTWADDGVAQSITERESGGKPSSRYSYLQHTWQFQVPAGSVSLHFNAWSGLSVDGDAFRFAYSLDDVGYTEMLTLAGGDDASWYSYLFPAGTSGTLYVRVSDTDRTEGNRNLDTVFVARMYVLSEAQAGDPPPAPSSLHAEATAAGRIDLSWIDESTDEYGFEVERSADGGASWQLLASLGTDTGTYEDTEVASLTAYSYRVRAFNGAGYSSYSNTATVTSLESSSIELSASAFKDKGWQNVDLAWSDGGVSFDVFRDGQVIASGIGGGAYSDTHIAKGGGSYTYQVCDNGSSSSCSNEVNVNF